MKWTPSVKNDTYSFTVQTFSLIQTVTVTLMISTSDAQTYGIAVKDLILSPCNAMEHNSKQMLSGKSSA